MPLTEEEWHRFLVSGDPQILAVCELPKDLCRTIGTSSPIVRMHHAYALKSCHKHGFDAYEFMSLPLTIDFGRCVCDREGYLTFFFFEQVVFGQWFHASLKRNKDGTEVWVTTFHHSRPGEVARRCKKSPNYPTGEMVTAAKPPVQKRGGNSNSPTLCIRQRFRNLPEPRPGDLPCHAQLLYRDFAIR